MVAVSAEGSTVWVLIRRMNSSWSHSIALVAAGGRGPNVLGFTIRRYFPKIKKPSQRGLHGHATFQLPVRDIYTSPSVPRLASDAYPPVGRRLGTSIGGRSLTPGSGECLDEALSNPCHFGIR